MPKDSGNQHQERSNNLDSLQGMGKLLFVQYLAHQESKQVNPFEGISFGEAVGLIMEVSETEVSEATIVLGTNDGVQVYTVESNT